MEEEIQSPQTISKILVIWKDGDSDPLPEVVQHGTELKIEGTYRLVYYIERDEEVALIFLRGEVVEATTATTKTGKIIPIWIVSPDTAIMRDNTVFFYEGETNEPL